MSGGIHLGSLTYKRRGCEVTLGVLGYRAQQALDYIRDEIERTGQAPSYAMIRDTIGFIHKRDVHRVIKSLEKRGLLSRVGSGRVRRIRLV